MSTITKEQLQQIEAAAKEVLWPVVWSEKKARKLFNEKITPEVVLELARIALASLGAEPVAYTEKCEITNMQATGLYLRGFPDGSHGRDIALYTAPTEPVSVPDESAVELLATDLMKRIDKITGERHSVATLSSLRVSIVESCRSAMLQGAAGNSPVIPDGWVACSERMPQESGRYWCYVEEQNDLGKSHYQWNCAWNGKRWWVEHEDGGRVTHWMPLPAAPQQEVK